MKSPGKTIELANRADWLNARREFVCASDAAKILGLSKFGGPLDVQLDKLGLQGEMETPWQMGGRRFESAILDWYADSRCVAIVHEPPHTLTVSPTHAHIAATLDARRVDVTPYAPVDAKNIRFETAEWGEEETDQMPFYYAVQLVIQMHVTGADFAELPTVFSGQDLKTYRLERDRDVEDEIVGKCDQWYRNHVLGTVPLEPDGSKSWGRYLSDRIKQRTELVVAATPELHEIAVSRYQLKLKIEELEAEKDRCDNLMKLAIGENKTLAGAQFKAHWSTVKAAQETNWKAVAEDLAAEVATERASRYEAEVDLITETTSDARVEADAMLKLALQRVMTPASIMAPLVQKHTSVRPGYRRFSFYFKP